MRRFTYFIAGVSGVNEQMAANFGLLRRFTGSGGEFVCPTIASCATGPTGRSGALFAEGPLPPTYDPARQRWTEGYSPRDRAEPLRYFVGITNGLQPMPDDLVREKIIDGYQPKLGDGNKWTVPLVLRVNPEAIKQGRIEHLVNLPQVMGMDGGKLGFTVRSDQKGILAVARKAWANYESNKTQPIEEAILGAVELLATNYRIGLEEAALLELFDPTGISTVLSLAVDMPVLGKWGTEMAAQNEVSSRKG